MRHYRQGALAGLLGVAVAGVGVAWAVGGESPAGLELPADADLRIDGARAGERAGGWVAFAGDFDGDGRDDALVVAPDADPPGAGTRGAVYLVLGRRGRRDVDLRRGRRVVRIVGTAMGRLRQAVPVGDVNGDGLDDITVEGRSTHVVFGRRGAGRIDLRELRDGGLQIDGSYALSGPVGDVNGDGRDDLLVWAPRRGGQRARLWVVLGREQGGRIALDALPGAGFRIKGFESWARGTAVGDVNGDGRDDLALSSTRRAAPRRRMGISWVVYGSPATRTVDLRRLRRGGFTLTGMRMPTHARSESEFAYLARQPPSVAAVGDVNGDRLPDVVFGAFAARHNGPISGSAYVVFGRRSSRDLDVRRLGKRGFRVDGDRPYAGTGFQVAAGGDMNGDRLDDILVGATGARPEGNPGLGAVWVVYGSRSTRPVALSDPGSRATAVFGGAPPGSLGGGRYGIYFQGVGDMNSDGRAELVATGSRRGMWLIDRVPAEGHVALGTAGSKALPITGLRRGRISGAPAFIGSGGDFNGDKRPDLLLPSPKADPRRRSQAGSVYVIHGGQLD